MFDMEASSSCNSEHDDEGQDLEVLLDAFQSVCSLREISSAYCKAGRNINLAAEILSESQGSTSSSAIDASNSELSGAKSSESSFDSFSENSSCANGNSKASKPKRYSVSAGTVSGIIGKEYVRLKSLTNESGKAIKPLKLHSCKLPISEPSVEKRFSDSAGKEAMHKDIEDFLLKMLGDGFKLDKDVIQKVLGSCGYDVKKSMEKLLDLSASTLDKSDDIVQITENFSDKFPEIKSLLCEGESQQPTDHAQINGSRVLNKYGMEFTSRGKERCDIGKELLASLFSHPERTEVQRRMQPLRAVERARPYGKVVVEPPTDDTEECKEVIVESQQDIESDGEDSYKVLRVAVKEHWVTMKEYYKAAADAFSEGDCARAEALLQEGRFFNNKARKEDEKSSQKMLEIRNNETPDEVLLDLHEHEAKEAIRLLKVHLTSLSGNPAFEYLKVVVDTKFEDITKGARKRLVMKLLEKESIKWTEDANHGTLLIHVREINPKCLSFAKTG